MKIVEIAQSRLAESYSELSGERPEAITTDLVAILLEIGVEVVKTCFSRRNSPQEVVAQAKRGGILARLQIRRAMRQAGVERLDRERVVTALLNAGARSKPEEIQQLAEAVD